MTSLSGKSRGKCGGIHLSGNTFSGQSLHPLSTELKRFKEFIMNQFFLPLIAKQWETLRENLFLLDSLKKKMQSYLSFPFFQEELSLYQGILSMLETILQEHRELEEIERRVYGTDADGKKQEIISFIFKTTAIRLKPEYEIYDLLFGKPQREKNQKYQEEIIENIQQMLMLENITFSKIKETVLHKYATAMNSVS